MANSITIDIAEIIKGVEKLKLMEKVLAERVDEVLNENAKDIATTAKDLAPVNLGGLRASINPDNSKLLEKHITVNAFYAPFIEFGTGRYAAQYVSTLPADWKTYAAQFRAKGKNPGTGHDLLMNLIDWVRAKGIHGLTKSGRSKTGKKAEEDIYNIAYVIAIRILRHGIKRHSFLFPAYEKQRPIILDNVEAVIKSLTT
jgi:phage protein, HK97 gp10 family